MIQPLEIHKYGIILRRLTQDKIELVRHWRNHPKIQRYMQFRQHITAEQQKEWFCRIDNSHNYYFLIIVNDEEIGLINVKDIDYDKAEGETGIFVWDDRYIGSIYTLKASLCLSEFMRETLKLKKSIIHVLRDNPRAIKYNKALGYTLSPDQEDIENQEYTRLLDSDNTYFKPFNKYLID